MNQGKWCSVDEIAAYLSVRRETIYRWIKSRNLPAHKIGTTYKARLTDIDLWVKDNASPSLLSYCEEEDEDLKKIVDSFNNVSSLDNLKHEDKKVDRRKDFENIKASFSSQIKFSDARNLLLQGDSLELIKKIPDHSISLIVTDPPYHSTKKSNIMGDTKFENDDEYLTWMLEYIHEWKRILKPNGSVYCFCSAEMSARLEVSFMKDFNILSNITWTKPNAPGFDGWKQKMKKEALRQWYPHSEKIIFAEPSFPGNLFNSYFGNLLRTWRKRINITMKDLAELTGAYGKVNHGGSVANWEAGRNIPSFDQYQKIVNVLKNLNPTSNFPDYYDVIRAFHTTGKEEFTDVWNFPNIRPYKGKHPAEKPIALLEHIITSSSYPGDIVLDCFSGSGSTGIAALKNHRLAISIELDENWLEHNYEVFKNLGENNYSFFPDNYRREDISRKKDKNNKQLDFTQVPGFQHLI